MARGRRRIVAVSAVIAAASARGFVLALEHPQGEGHGGGRGRGGADSAHLPRS
jgi:hypothetical protein